MSARAEALVLDLRGLHALGRGLWAPGQNLLINLLFVAAKFCSTQWQIKGSRPHQSLVQ